MIPLFFNRLCVFLYFFGWLGLSLLSCEDSTPTTNNTTTIKTQTDLPLTPLYELAIPDNHVALYGHLDDHLYVQLVDTTTVQTTERSNSPVYECACKIAGSCKINASGPHTVACVPKAESCTSEDSPLPDERGHRCAFSKVAASAVPSTLRTVMTLANDFQVRNGSSTPSFDAQGVRAVNYYTLEFEDSQQLKALYTLKDGQTLVEYVPKDRGEPIRVSCSCSCASGSTCEMTINSSNSISCRSQSGCMPETNGDPCDGCRFKVSDRSWEQLEPLVAQKQVLGND
jgi:hypothetical protein